MTNDVDVYNIARILISEQGIFARDEAREKINHYKVLGDYSSIKTWFAVEDAIKEIEEMAEKV